MPERVFEVTKWRDYVPGDHPPRGIRVPVIEAPIATHARPNAICALSSRNSIAPEELVRALLQVFNSIRSKR